MKLNQSRIKLAKFVLKVVKQLVQKVNNNAKLQKSIITSMLLLFMPSFD